MHACHNAVSLFETSSVILNSRPGNTPNVSRSRPEIRARTPVATARMMSVYREIMNEHGEINLEVHACHNAVSLFQQSSAILTLQTPTLKPYTLHPTPYALHPTPYPLHPTPYTLHPQP